MSLEKKLYLYIYLFIFQHLIKGDTKEIPQCKNKNNAHGIKKKSET